MEISEETREGIIEDYLSGLSLWSVGQKYHWVKKAHLRQVLDGVIRPKHQTQRTPDPSEDEIRERSERIKASWPDEVASRRWVGRFIPRSEDRGSCLSRLFRDMGGDG
jgi:hypothetical protein